MRFNGNLASDKVAGFAMIFIIGILCRQRQSHETVTRLWFFQFADVSRGEMRLVTMGVRQTDHSRGGALGRSPASAAKNSEHCSLTIVIGYGRTLHETAALRYVTYDTYRRGGFGLVCPFETAYFQSVMKAAAWRFRPSPTK